MRWVGLALAGAALLWMGCGGGARTKPPEGPPPEYEKPRAFELPENKPKAVEPGAEEAKPE